MSRASRIFIGLFLPPVALEEGAPDAQDQDQFRFGADDGNETAHGWIAAQNINISQDGSTAAILRIQVNNTGDFPTQQMKLQYKITTQPDSEYRDVPVAP